MTKKSISNRQTVVGKGDISKLQLVNNDTLVSGAETVPSDEDNVYCFAVARQRRANNVLLESVQSIVVNLANNPIRTRVDCQRALFGLELASHLAREIVGNVKPGELQTDLLAESASIDGQIALLRLKLRGLLVSHDDTGMPPTHCPGRSTI